MLPPAHLYLTSSLTPSDLLDKFSDGTESIKTQSQLRLSRLIANPSLPPVPLPLFLPLLLLFPLFFIPLAGLIGQFRFGSDSPGFVLLTVVPSSLLPALDSLRRSALQACLPTKLWAHWKRIRDSQLKGQHRVNVTGWMLRK